MKTFVLTAIMTIVWLGSFTALLHPGQAHDLQPNVVIIGQEWFKNAAPSHTRYSPFRLSDDSLLEPAERYSRLCPITRKPETHSQGECPFDGSMEQGREGAKEVDEFVYMVRVRNSGQKTIKAIQWDYVFIDPTTGKELARHTFYSERQLSPGKTKTLIATSVKPPTRIITVEMLYKEADTYREEVEIKHVEHADGSVWEKKLS